jgi:hypothetical protein
MSTQIPNSLTQLRQPEYTGENRCLPCTIANVAIATLFGFALAILSIPIGLLVFVCALAAIYVRGYLIPGTPELTTQYLPPSVLRLFGKEPVTERAIYTVENPEDLDVGRVLSESGALADEADKPTLTPAFRERLYKRIEEVRERGTDPEDVAELFDVEEVKPQSETSFGLSNGLVRWDSTAALIADIAAGEELRTRLDGWEDLERSARRDLFTGVRLALDSCPTCDSTLSMEEHQLDPCCQKSHTVVQSICAECDVAIVEVTVMGIDEEMPARTRFLRS